MKIDVFASGSSGNCYRISDGKTTLLLDAGISIKRIRECCEFKLCDVAGCLITHEHQDHSKAGKDLAAAGIDVYGSPGTLLAMNWVGYRFKLLHVGKGAKVIGTLAVTPIPVEHDAAEPLGFIITSLHSGANLLYVTDTHFVRYAFLSMPLTHIMVECNYTEAAMRKAVAEGRTDPQMAKRIIHTHMSLETLLEFFAASDLSQVRQIYLLHLSDRNSDEKEMKNQVQRATGAEVHVC